MGQVSQQAWPTFNSASDTDFGMIIYKVIKKISYTIITCYYSQGSKNLEVFWIIMVHYKLYTLQLAFYNLWNALKILDLYGSSETKQPKASEGLYLPDPLLHRSTIGINPTSKTSYSQNKY